MGDSKNVAAGAVEGEVRLRVEGGFAHFPGRAREQVASLAELPDDLGHEIVELARRANFFGREQPPCGTAGPDARTYMLRLTMDGRSREVSVAEPITDSDLAKLMSTVRRCVFRRT